MGSLKSLPYKKLVSRSRELPKATRSDPLTAMLRGTKSYIQLDSVHPSTISYCIGRTNCLPGWKKNYSRRFSSVYDLAENDIVPT